MIANVLLFLKVQFNPGNPSILFAAARQTEDVHYWDVRNTSRRLGTIERKGCSNQRRRFDLDLSGKWIAVGNEVCQINFFFRLESHVDLFMISRMGSLA